MSNLYNVPLQNNIQRTLANTLNAGETSTITFSTSVSAVLQASASIPGILVIDRVDVNGTATPSLTEYISFTGVSGSTVTGLTRGLAGSSDISHSVGAIVEFVPDVTWADAINDVITTEHDADGQHKINTFSNLNAPEGFLINGKIVPSVSSNNLTVALKTLAGNDPSTSDPIYIRINGVVRTITSALSVDATQSVSANWFNLGSAELATKEADLFTYLGYGTVSNRVFIAISRVPYGLKQGDLNTTVIGSDRFLHRNETANDSDAITVIGRFAATLSASPYNWSVPTFDSSNLIQRPIYETRPLTAVPTMTSETGSAGSFSANPYTSTYMIRGRQLFFSISIKILNKGSWGLGCYIIPPMNASSTYLTTNYPLAGFIAPVGANPVTGSRGMPFMATVGLIGFYASINTTALLWSGVVNDDVIGVSGSYFI